MSTEIERVLVVGGGAIGGLFAGHFAEIAETWMLVRRTSHASAVNRHGLRISGKRELLARPTATTDPGVPPEPQLIVVAVKATQLDEVAVDLAGRFPRAAMMTVQNGLGAEEVMRAAGPWPLISGVTFMSGIRHGDEHVEYELDTATWLGPYAESETPFALVEAVQTLIVRSGLHATALPDLLPAQWSKMIFNAAVNGVGALTGTPHIAAYAERSEPQDVGHLVHALMEEGKAVAAAAGVALYEDPWEMNVRAVLRGQSESGSGSYAHVTSMLEDVQARRPTEIDFICGPVVRTGERLGLPAPLHAALWRLIKAKELSWSLAHGTEQEV